MAETRERWDSRGAFIMAAIGSAIGLGNVWRFPFIVGQNGGGAFFIPYFVALLTAGVPLMIVEYALGVKYQGSAAKSFRKIGKGWEWIGWWGLMVGTTISIYYCVIMSWSWMYLYHAVVDGIFGNGVPWQGIESDYFRDIIQERSGGPDETGVLLPWVILGLAVTWLCIWWIIHKGVKRVGKIVMLTVPLPVLILGVLFVRGITLEGSAEGIAYYLTPDFEALTRPKVWLAAYGQIFFSLSLGFGILIAYASYLPRRSDITNNAFNEKELETLTDAVIETIGPFSDASISDALAFQDIDPDELPVILSKDQAESLENIFKSLEGDDDLTPETKRLVRRGRKEYRKALKSGKCQVH